MEKNTATLDWVAFYFYETLFLCHPERSEGSHNIGRINLQGDSSPPAGGSE